MYALSRKLIMQYDQYMSSKSNDLFDSLKSELDGYIKSGISLSLQGRPSNSYKIARACRVSENATYMRDYISDENGEIKAINFTKVTISSKK